MKKVVWFVVFLIALILIVRLQVERGVPARSDTGQEGVVMSDTNAAINEVKAVHTLIVNFLTAVKEPYRPPLGDNEDFVKALTGGNRYGDVYIATNDPSINNQGQWVDRWGTPYHFHPRSADAIDVRSAGPDHQLFTPDDVFIQLGTEK